jgi:hypothetical protein
VEARCEVIDVSILLTKFDAMLQSVLPLSDVMMPGSLDVIGLAAAWQERRAPAC